MLWIFAERFFMAALRQCEKSEGCFAVFTAQPWTAAVLFKLQFSDGLLVLPPHIFADVQNSMAIAQEETFGPIAPIIKVHGEAEALRVANDTEFGLTSAVFTGDIERGARFALRVQAGMTHVNDATFAESLTGPFGGEKNSGLGRFGGEWIINEFTRDHWVTVRHEKVPYFLTRQKNSWVSSG